MGIRSRAILNTFGRSKNPCEVWSEGDKQISVNAVAFCTKPKGPYDQEDELSAT
jgi:hypothetical protein